MTKDVNLCENYPLIKRKFLSQFGLILPESLEASHKRKLSELKKNGPKKQSQFSGVICDNEALDEYLLALVEIFTVNHTSFFRIKKQLYISAEIGNEEKNTNYEYVRSTSKGNYIKFGTKFRLNKIIPGTQNLTYSGINVGFSSFNQTINNYTIYNIHNSTWGESNINTPIYSPDLSAFWFELIFGLKTEIFNNLFLKWLLEL